ncbi:MAG TPA: glycosyltransferase family 4 protein [Pyrinomonadaceae bacterium]|nr:glycosyltransferase family 4 protein [Pyrinomonadaceae bacterium]
MKILQISSASTFGGGERYVVDLTNALQSRGHDLYVVVRPNSPLPGYLEIPKDNIKELPLRNALDAPSARDLDRFIKEHEIDIVHAHMARDYSLAAYATRRNPSARFFVTRHVLFKLNSLHRRTLSRATRVIAVSHAVERELQGQQLVSDEQIAVIPNGIDVEKFKRAESTFDRTQFLSEKNLPDARIWVGTIGELRTLKRHDDFIRAAAKVAQGNPDVHFIVAGIDPSKTGEVRRTLKHLVAELGLKDRVHFLGWLDNATQLYCLLDVFVSASEMESFGLVIAEAMSVGKPVVATMTEGAMEVIEDEKTGMLVPIGEPERMAEAINELLASEDKRRELGTIAREAVNRKFSLGRMVDDIERLYLMK